MRTLGATHVAFPSALRDELLALQSVGNDEIARAARSANLLADLYAMAIKDACKVAGVAPHDLVAAGVHGQTVRHRPEQGWTLQINNPARVAERAYVTVVADFRSRDIAAGGQGAPLVPAFHAALFRRRGATSRRRQRGRHRQSHEPSAARRRQRLRHGARQRPDGPVVRASSRRAFRRGRRMGGAGARSMRRCWSALLAEPFFAASPPKSTGRDLFNAGWLEAMLTRAQWQGRPEDAQATFAALTARTIADAVRAHAAGATEMLVCGGGAQERHAAAVAGRRTRSAHGRDDGRSRRRGRSRRGARVRLAGARGDHRPAVRTCRR